MGVQLLPRNMSGLDCNFSKGVIKLVRQGWGWGSHGVCWGYWRWGVDHTKPGGSIAGGGLPVIAGSGGRNAQPPLVPIGRMSRPPEPTMLNAAKRKGAAIGAQ